MSDLPTDIVISYQSFDFGASVEIVSVDLKMHYDQAGRMLAWTDYTITIGTYLFADDPDSDNPPETTTDDLMDELRPVLMQPGGNLVIQNAGLGDFDIQNTLDDVRWGPKPMSIKLRQSGSSAAWYLTWTVMVSIAGECNSRILPFGNIKGPLSFNYAMAYSEDESRYTTRTYTGYLQIAMSRGDVATLTLPDNVDSYREKLTPAIPYGFRRTHDDWRISEDKSELRFNITDTQMPNGRNFPPPGVLHCEASQSLTSKGPKFNQSFNTLKASYELAPGVAPQTALGYFLALYKDRRGQSLALFKKHVPVLGPSGLISFPIPTSLSWDEPEIYGRRTANFSMTWRYAMPAFLFLQASGMWRTVPGSNWQQWFTSLSKIMGPRGSAGLKFLQTDDLLINLCSLNGAMAAPAAPPVDPAPAVRSPRLKPRDAGSFNPPVSGGGFSAGTPITTPSGGGSSISSQGGQNSPFSPSVLSALGLDGQVPEEVSWLDYQINLQIEVLDNTVVLPLLPQKPVQLRPPPTDEDDLEGHQIGYLNPGVPTHVSQLRSYPTIFVTVSGSAIRAGGWEITPPQLIAAGGVPAVPANIPGTNFARSWVAGNMAGTPVVAAAWSLRWSLAGIPTSPIQAPNNPIYGDPAEEGGFGTTTDI